MNPSEKLKSALCDTAGVYVNPGVDRERYLKDLSDDIIRNECEPFLVSAIAMPPGFPNVADGDLIEGWCVARKDGYWLVYQPAQDIFFCFWGSNINNLGAHGIYGAPLYCWSA